MYIYYCHPWGEYMQRGRERKKGGTSPTANWEEHALSKVGITHGA